MYIDGLSCRILCFQEERRESMVQTNDNFIMLPTVDFCFKELMQNEKVRKGFIAALLELHILELGKLPEKVRNEEGVIRWMRFFNGKTREDFKEMAKTDQYIEEAYSELEKLSADEQKRLEYEAREKAVRDYNTLMDSAVKEGLRQGVQQGLQQGIQQGIQQGVQQGIQRGRLSERQALIRQMLENGMKAEDIVRFTGITPEEIKTAENCGIKQEEL